MKRIIFFIFYTSSLFSNVDDYINQINSLLKEKAYDEGLVLFEKGIKEYDASSKLFFIGGELYLKLDDLDEANKNFIKAIELDSKNEEYRARQKELEKFKQLLLSARKTFDSGLMDDAIIEYEKLALKYPSYAILFYNLGLVYKANSELISAVDNYKKAQNLNPFEEKYFKAVKVIAQMSAKEGDVEYRRQEFDLAIKKYEQAIDYFPEYTTAMFKLARTYYKLKDLESSMNILTKALLIDPSQEQSEKMLGDIYRKLDNPDEAIKHYALAVEINSNYYQAYYSLGSLYLSEGLFSNAQSALMNAIKIEPTYSKAYGALGTVEQELGNIDASIKNYLEAIKYDKKAYDIYYRLASAYNHIELFDDAKTYAKKSVNIKRNYAPAYFELGMAEKSLGNKVAAKDAFEKAKKDRNWRKSAQYELDMMSKGL